MNIDPIQLRILQEVAGLHDTPDGAFNFRFDGKSAGRASTDNIKITSKEDKSGIDINIAPGTTHESVHIPVVLSESGLKEAVYNDFFIGDNSDVTIVAGCGISNCGGEDSQHDGIHTFHIGNNCKVRYYEKHYGEGDGMGKRILNPVTEVYMGENSYMEMEMAQIKGVDSTIRKSDAHLGAGSQLVVHERLMTHGEQKAVSEYNVYLDGESASTNVVSRSVARDRSNQTFISRLYGNAEAHGHSECDSIIMDDARISSIPEVVANCPDAELIHEAAIGKIAGEQITKLMTFGLTQEEAEEQIVNGFLK